MIGEDKGTLPHIHRQREVAFAKYKNAIRKIILVRPTQWRLHCCIASYCYEASNVLVIV